jgi:hypothetical protein
MPGIGLEIDGAMQQAPQSGRQSISASPGGVAELKPDNSSTPSLPPAESYSDRNLSLPPFFNGNAFLA